MTDPLDKPMDGVYNRKGEKLTTLREYVEQFNGDRGVGRTDIGEGDEQVTVSTVFLVLDHNHTRMGRPLLFETMVFGGDHDQTCTRYATEEEAVDGHSRTVAAVRAGEDPFGWEDQA